MADFRFTGGRLPPFYAARGPLATFALISSVAVARGELLNGHRSMASFMPFPAQCLAFLALSCAAGAAAAGDAPPAMRPAAELIRRPDPPVINSQLAAKITPENSRLYISLAKQRGYLLVGEEVYIDTPISTGKSTCPTATGTHPILEMVKEYRSSIYGDFVDKKGRPVQGGVSMKVDSAPSGTHYIGTPMKFYCRIHEAGFGIYAGPLPGYPASHGGIRVPLEVAKLIYAKVRPGTKVEIRAE